MTFLGSPGRARWAFVAAAAVAMCLLVLIGVHTPPVRALVLGRTLSWLISRAGLEVSADDLS